MEKMASKFSVLCRWERSDYRCRQGLNNKVQRQALLHNLCGIEYPRYFWCFAKHWWCKDYQKAKDALTAHFVTPILIINIPYERHLFREMVQEENETVDQNALRLPRCKAQQCDYGDQMEAQIRDQLVRQSQIVQSVL